MGLGVGEEQGTQGPREAGTEAGSVGGRREGADRELLKTDITSREAQARTADVAPVWVGGRGPGSGRAKLPRYPSSAPGDSGDDTSAPARRAGLDPRLPPSGPPLQPCGPAPQTPQSALARHAHAPGRPRMPSLGVWRRFLVPRSAAGGRGLGAVTAQVQEMCRYLGPAPDDRPRRSRGLVPAPTPPAAQRPRPIKHPPHRRQLYLVDRKSASPIYDGT